MELLGLEVQLQSKLNVAAVSSNKDSTSVISNDSVVRIVKVGVIEDVKKLRAELKIAGLAMEPDFGVLDDRHGQINETRPSQKAPGYIAQVPQGLLHEHVGIEPLRWLANDHRCGIVDHGVGVAAIS